jgi:hypothetical protein
VAGAVAGAGRVAVAGGRVGEAAAVGPWMGVKVGRGVALPGSGLGDAAGMV